MSEVRAGMAAVSMAAMIPADIISSSERRTDMSIWLTERLGLVSIPRRRK